MKNSQLCSVLAKIKLNECDEIYPNHIYYINKKVTLSTPNWDNRRSYFRNEYEFLVIARNGIKQGIILRCGTVDLHWYVFKQYREEHVLSEALKTGVINQIWPENKYITCHYEYGEDREKKYQMTKHLADLANLELIETN